MAVPIDRITRQAREVHAGRALLTALMAPLYVLGWIVGKAAVVTMFVLAAVKIGWQDARGSDR